MLFKLHFLLIMISDYEVLRCNMHLRISCWAAILITSNFSCNIAQSVLFYGNLQVYIWPLHLQMVWTFLLHVAGCCFWCSMILTSTFCSCQQNYQDRGMESPEKERTRRQRRNWSCKRRTAKEEKSVEFGGWRWWWRGRRGRSAS